MTNEKLIQVIKLLRKINRTGVVLLSSEDVTTEHKDALLAGYLLRYAILHKEFDWEYRITKQGEDLINA